MTVSGVNMTVAVSRTSSPPSSVTATITTAITRHASPAAGC